MLKVLITKKIPSIAQELLRKQFAVDIYQNPSISPSEMKNFIQEYDVILSSTLDVLDKEILQNSTRLQVISNYAVGLDNIDVTYAESKGISVYNLPDIVTESTADTTFAIFLALVRNIPRAVQYVRDDQWKTWIPGLFDGEELSNKTFGIWGFGRTGRAVAKRALGFGLKVIFYHYKNQNLSNIDSQLYQQVSMEKFLSCSDYISLHVPLKKDTYKMVNQQVFNRMEKRPILLNMSRGAVVDTDDLVKALKEKKIRGAALDVTDPEPLPGDHPLCRLDNCLVVPHIGTDTFECRYKMAEVAAQNIINHFFS